MIANNSFQQSVLCAFLTWGAISASAQPIPIINADFETDLAVTRGATGWTITQGAMYVTAGANLNVTEPTSASQGNNFLTANRIAPDPDDAFPSDQTMSIYQDLSVSMFASQIAQGGLYAKVSFSYCAPDNGDSSVVSLEFRDSGQTPLGTASFDGTSVPTANGVWSTATFAGAVPVTTATIRLSITSKRIASAGTQRNVSFDAISAQLVDTPPPTRDMVHGNLIQFTENGAWCWFQDERAVVDTNKGVLTVGSLANYAGIGGEPVDGQVRTTQFNMATGTRTTYALRDHLESWGGGDEHNAPALLVKEDGNILAFYAAHNQLSGTEDDRSYYRTFDVETQIWSPEMEWHWWSVMPANAPGTGGSCYSNVYQLSSEDPDGDGHGRLYNFARVRQYQQIMFSDDNGATWKFGGQLTKQAANPPSSNYVNGYYRYVSNGVDRIDILATEFHPGDYNTSINHAYIRGGKMFDTTGNVIDSDIFSGASSFDAASMVSVNSFTRVFQAGTDTNTHAWNTDIQTYADGNVAVLFKTRAGLTSGDHRVWYGRYTPAIGTWTVHEIAKAGARLFSSQIDYTGLGALDPNDPDVVYISTEISPETQEQLACFEIFKGATGDGGATWSWTAITENSSCDNLRPIIPRWAGGKTALLWFKGALNTSQNFDASVVGVILGSEENKAKIQYVDATLTNTSRVDGQAFNPTSGANDGAADGNWHLRTGVGNGASVFTADEVAAENAPPIKTTVPGMRKGMYDVFVYFWCDSAADWRIQAGLATSNLNLFRTRGAQHAQYEESSGPLTISEVGRGLYRAYVGRADLAENASLEVVVDDHTGSSGSRVCYDGIGYVPVPSFEQWQIAHFGNFTVSAADPTADPDGDGLSNESEFQWGSDPQNVASRFGASAFRSGGSGAVTVTWTSVPGEIYVIEYNSDLKGGWQTLATKTGDPSPATTTSFDDPISADVPRRFYRVRIGP